MKWRIWARLDKYFHANKRFVGTYYEAVYKKCLAEDFDLIIAEGGNYAAFRKFSEDFGKKKLALHIHHNLHDSKDIAGIFGSTIAVSNFINDDWVRSKKEFKEDNSQANYVLVNAVDESKFSKELSEEERAAIRASMGAKDDDFLVGYIGRIQDVKGVIELVEAVNKIKNPRVKLAVIGASGFSGSSNTSYYNKVIRRIDSSARCVHLGYVDNCEVYKYAKSFDLRCMPSLWEEAGSIALVEAIHCGVPLVVTRSGGMPEVVSKKGAIIIEKTGDVVENIRHAIEDISKMPESKIEAMIEANLEQSKKFTKKAFYENFIKITEEIMNGD
jgi:spore coat protein SA